MTASRQTRALPRRLTVSVNRAEATLLCMLQGADTEIEPGEQSASQNTFTS